MAEKIEAVYYRYLVPYVEECDSIAGAVWFLSDGEERGALSSVGVFVDGKCVRHDPWFEPDLEPNEEQARLAQEDYEKATR